MKFNRFFIVFLFTFSLVNAQNLKLNIHPTISGGAVMNELWQKQLSPKYSSPIEKLLSEAQTPQVRVSSDLIGAVTEAIDFEQDGSNTGYYHIPPDNSGCAGPQHFLLVVNTSIEWYTKDRTKQHSEDLDTFFNATSPTYGLFDPKVLYDQYQQRFLIVALEKNLSNEVSNIHIAVSQTSDPNDGWYFQKINASLIVDGYNSWADFPGVGVSDNAFYITANMFDYNTNGFRGSRLWIFDKNLYSGTASTYHVYDPSTEAGSSSQAFTLQPSHSFGILPGNVGTFLFDSGWQDSNGNDFIQIIRVDNPLNSPSFNEQFISLGDVHNGDVPEAPQAGTSDLIDFGDNRAQSSVWRDNRLVGAFTVNPPSGTNAGQATVLWFDVETSDIANLSLTQSGFVGGEDIASNTYTSYPAVAVNQDGDIAIGFSASASSIYAGAYYTMHKSSDAQGTVENSQTLHAGVDWYYRVFSGTRNRWGDYSAISVDPSDDLNFWVFNQYAWTRGSYSGGDGRWKTCFANFGTIEVPQYLEGTQITTNSITLQWSGRSAEFRLLQDGIEIYTGSDTSYTVNSLNPGTNYTFDLYGKASGQQVYSNDHITLSITTAASTQEDNPTDVISGTPTFNVGEGNNEFEIKDTGVWLTFPSGVTNNTEFTAAKKSGDPGINGSLPTGISTISKERNWTVRASGGTNVGTYNIRFDLSGVSGIDNFNTLKILKRNDASSPWENVESLGATLSYNEPYITVSGLTSFSDFAIASTGDNSLPVQLTSFTAQVQNNIVLLKWRTESEVENLGFIIERKKSDEEQFQKLADYHSCEALKGSGNSSVAHTYAFMDSTVEQGETYWYKLIDVHLNGEKSEHEPLKITVENKDEVLKNITAQTLPNDIELYPNYPNPFNPSTTFTFAIPSRLGAIKVELILFDLQGRKIKTLLHRRLNPGMYAIQWNARNEGHQIASGEYILVLKTGRLFKSRKILLVK